MSKPQPPQSDLLLQPDKVVSDLRLIGKCSPYDIPPAVEQRAMFHIVRILSGQPLVEGGKPPREREIRAAISALHAMKKYNLDLAKAETGLDLDRVRERIALALQVNVTNQQPAEGGRYDDLIARTLGELDALLGDRVDGSGEGTGGESEGQTEGPRKDSESSPFDAA